MNSQRTTTHTQRLCFSAVLASSLALSGHAFAKLDGAIFTTTPGGEIVNENVRYESKLEVFLDGGPGPNAPAVPLRFRRVIIIFR
ncbi:hypothetical protein [Vibrio variabilis]|uniref:hypothetical protein n=1 Tax=Vibrio variabilis TaxID=990271 RepID=UPI001EFA2311|nr:hypothetical protein [Vibrio variabilis]